MFLKPIPARSDYPFDPDNPVPNGTQLNPAELRAKYYKVINPESRFYSGDARLQRDRRAERDPKRTTKFKSMRADGQEFNEGTHHYLIDDVVSGRWFGKEHGHETRVELDFEAMSKKPCHVHDHDMFSLVSNKYGREYHPNRGDPKKDFITMNAMFAKFGGTVGKGTKERGSSTQKTRGPSTLTNPSKTELATACNALVDPDAAPFMLRWLESQATNGDKISFMKAFQALSKSTAKKPTAHQKALAHAQTLRRMIKAGISADGTNSRAATRVRHSHSVAPKPVDEWQRGAIPRQQLHASELESHGNSSRSMDLRQISEAASNASQGKSAVPNQVGTFRPDTASIDALPMPPADGEVPPPERRHAGVYPFDWKPRPRVQQLKDKLQDILSTKHKQLKISFRRFDEDHHGTIDLNELYRVMVVESGLKCTRAELEEVWDLFDRDRDGVVKYADYSKTMGNDALDERDFFQIAHRKAAGRYNEEVKFFASRDEEHLAAQTKLDDPKSAVNLNMSKVYEKMEEQNTHGHDNLFCLPERRTGALFNEKFTKASHTVPNTHAHNLRLEVAAKVSDSFGSVESAFDHYSEGRGHMSEHYFGLMIEDLGIQAEPRTIHELFSVYDKDLDGKIDVDNFCDSFNLERQSIKKPDIFFQDVVLTDVPKDGKPFQRRPAAAKQSYAELEKMFLPKRAAKSELGKLVPARSRSVAGVSPARKRLGDISHEHHDLPVGSMLPPRPMTAMSASGGFDMHAPSLQQRAVTPLQQLQALQKTSTEVRDLTSDLPQRETSTPLVSAPRDSINDHGPSALAPTAGNIRPKSSVPKGVATDFKIRPRTSGHVQNNGHIAPIRSQVYRPLTAAEDPNQQRREPSQPMRMRPMSAADYLAPAPRKREGKVSRPLSEAVQPLYPAAGRSAQAAKTSTFTQER